MADKRRLQVEIERCHKKVQEGCEGFDDLWEKFNCSSNTSQKEKLEGDLKREIKKLQRLRDQIKQWTNGSEIRDKAPLVENRKKIEQRMERFKLVEKETKTKAFSKEGLGAGMKLDPAAKEKKEVETWLQESISQLELQIEQFESEIESLSTPVGKRRGKGDKKQNDDKSAKLNESLERHRYHISTLETILRMLNNDVVDVKKIKFIQEDVNYYVESNQDEEFVENEDLYDDLNLNDHDTETFGVQAVVGHSDTFGHSGDHSSSGSEPHHSSNHHSTANHTLSNTSSHSKDTTSDTSYDSRSRHRSTSGVTNNSSNGSSSTNTNSHSSSEDVNARVSSTTTTSSSTSSRPTVVIPGSKPHSSSVSSETSSVPLSAGNSSVPSTPMSSLPTAGSNTSSSFAAAFSAATNAALSQSSVAGNTNSSSTNPVPSSPAPSQQISYSNAAASSAASSAAAASTAADHLSRQNSTDVRSTNTPPLSVTPNSTAGSSVGNSLSNSSMPSPAPSPAISDSKASTIAQTNGSTGDYMNGPSSIMNGPAPKGPSNGMASLQAMAQSAVASQLNQANKVSQQQQPPPSTTPPSGLTGSSSSITQTSSIRISPLLGVAPLGPKKLTNENRQQADMLMAAFLHMPHPSDSERLRHYLPRNPCPTPGYYPQTLPSHGDTITFFERLSTEALFFVFYYMEGTKAQYFAARALKKQSWRFHTKYMMWFQRHDEPRSITDEYEQGTYIYFDYEKWGQRRKEGFTFEYRFLEDRDLN